MNAITTNEYTNNFPRTVYSSKDFSTNKKLIKEQLLTHGIVLISDIHMEEDAISIADSLGITLKSIDADNNGITDISNYNQGKNAKNSAAFTKEGLLLHTDRSPIPSPPTLLMNWMSIKDCIGGESLLADGYQIFRFLLSNQPKTLAVLTQPDMACFTDGIDTFTGSIFHFDQNHSLQIRFRYDRCSFFKPEAKKAVEIFLKTAEKFTHIIDFNIGCGYLIDNRRWLHGRRPFEGNRCVKRIHIQGDK